MFLFIEWLCIILGSSEVSPDSEQNPKINEKTTVENEENYKSCCYAHNDEKCKEIFIEYLDNLKESNIIDNLQYENYCIKCILHLPDDFSFEFLAKNSYFSIMRTRQNSDGELEKKYYDANNLIFDKYNFEDVHFGVFMDLQQDDDITLNIEFNYKDVHKMKNFSFVYENTSPFKNFEYPE
ncbi:hypothetical protein NUSPORA_00525 [Nucleospora cyclopteri]